MMRRTEDGAVKCALRFFRLEEVTALDLFIVAWLRTGAATLAMDEEASVGQLPFRDVSMLIKANQLQSWSDGGCGMSRGWPGHWSKWAPSGMSDVEIVFFFDEN